MSRAMMLAMLMAGVALPASAEARTDVQLAQSADQRASAPVNQRASASAEQRTSADPTAATTQADAGGQVAADPQTAPPEQQDSPIADIVVTAQKRSENLQNVPISITALAPATLAARGITSTADLQLATPGLNFTAAASSAQPRIRGVGTTAAGPGIENPVATYIDGVYIAAMPSSVLALNNIAQVSVLKGPQGTLFGRNATGGVLQVTTLDPQSQFSGRLGGTVGNRGLYGGNLYVTGGLADGLSSDLAVYYNNISNGFGRNISSGRPISTNEDLAIRSKTIWELAPGTSLKLSFDYEENHQNGPAQRPVYGAVATGGYMFNGGKFDIASDIEPRVTVRQGGVSAQLSHDFGGVKLVNIAAYRQSLFDLYVDNDKTPRFLTTIVVAQHDRQISEELQLVSDTRGRFQWLVGGFYFDSIGHDSPFAIYAATLPPPVLNSSLFPRQTTKSYAAFGQGTYRFGEATNLTVGLRYTDESRHFSNRQETVLRSGSVVPGASTRGDLNFGKLTWRLSLDHRFSPEALLYASYNRGARSGSFSPIAIVATPVNPEVLDAYETGAKLDLFDRHVRLNLAAFYYDYKNIQLGRFENGVQVVFNAQGATLYGLDADATVAITDRLSIQGGASYIHSRLANFPNGVASFPLPGGGNRIGSADATGHKVPATPSLTLSLSPTYRVLTSFGSIALSADYYHNSGWYAEVDNRLRQPSYDLFGASVLIAGQDDKYTLRLWSRNLTNVAYAINLTSTNFDDGIQEAQGRSFGATVGLKF